MRQKRYEFSDNIKAQAMLRAKGHCEDCGAKIVLGNGPEYHHRYLPATEPGSNTLDNCQVLCNRPCHKKITATETIPKQAKDKRVYAKSIGLRKSKRGFRKPPKNYDPWTRTMRNDE